MHANGYVDSPSRVTGLNMMHVFIIHESLEKIGIACLHVFKVACTSIKMIHIGLVLFCIMKALKDFWEEKRAKRGCYKFCTTNSFY